MQNRVKQLSQQCVSHLGKEEALVGELQATIAEMRRAMLSRDSTALEAVTRRYETTLKTAVAMADQRTHIRKQISHVYGVSDDRANISRVAQDCDSKTQATLMGYQARIRSSCEQLNKSLVSTGNLTLQLMQLIENVFRTLSGENPQTSIYDETGRPRLPRTAA